MDDRDLKQIHREIGKLQDQIDDLAEAKDVAGLRRTLDSTKRELETSRRDVERAVRDLAAAGREIADLGSRADTADETVEALRREIREADAEHARSVGSLRRTVMWLEHQIRHVPGAVHADLGADDHVRELARVAEQGKDLEAQFLAPGGRAARERASSAWSTWQDRHRAACRAVVAASRTIAGSVPEAGERPRAEAAYRAARSELDDLYSRRDATWTAAMTAEAELRADDEGRSTNAEDIRAASDAAVSLRERLTAQLTGAIERGELLPRWFTAVLGLGPHRDSANWARTGVDLLAYRATYDITDPVVALGPEPDPATSSARRRKWHQALATRFRTFE